MTWTEITLTEPRLQSLADLIGDATPPTRQPDYGRCVLALLDTVERIAGPLGEDAVRVACDHMHKIYTDQALIASGVDA
jgi:hypothetical protein